MVKVGLHHHLSAHSQTLHLQFLIHPYLTSVAHRTSGSALQLCPALRKFGLLYVCFVEVFVAYGDIFYCFGRWGRVNVCNCNWVFYMLCCSRLLGTLRKGQCLSLVRGFVVYGDIWNCSREWEGIIVWIWYSILLHVTIFRTVLDIKEAWMFVLTIGFVPCLDIWDCPGQWAFRGKRAGLRPALLYSARAQL